MTHVFKHPKYWREMRKELQAASLKLQAASSKLLNLATLIKFQATRGEVHRKDKTILRMLQMECKLVWTEA